MKKIFSCSLSREMIEIALFTCPCSKEKVGLCSTSSHIHAMTGNCSTSLPVLVNSLPVVSVMTGNLRDEHFTANGEILMW